ncbi:MAG: phosphoribosylaminoimidazolesuccinocarboxamide synthase [Planctomycetota bacterium]
MSDAGPLLHTDLPLPGRRQGKVRDVYQCTLRNGSPAVMLVATDRLSAFDVVMPDGPPGKGKLLTAASECWFGWIAQHFGDAMLTHVLGFDPAQVQGLSDKQFDQLRGRITLGKPCKVIPLECVVRGRLTGGGWKEYQATGKVSGVELPAGLSKGDALPEPVFTPSTKAEVGHDEPLDPAGVRKLLGEELAEDLQRRSLELFRAASQHALERGLVLIDTKYEFGLPIDEAEDATFTRDTSSGAGAGSALPLPLGEGGGEGSAMLHVQAANAPILIDEAMTPDSSRYWLAEEAEDPSRRRPFDKQVVRDHLQALRDAGAWNGEAPGPRLDAALHNETLARYAEVVRRLTGRAFDS